MLIDFKEIPQANIGGGLQDTFELFARDFLELLGYHIIQNPDRGADRKKDLIVSEERKGVGGKTIIKWLVSCKHNAHSGKSVSDTDESDIIDRVSTHKCDGFLGVYSTIPASSLNNKLSGIEDKIEFKVFDKEEIEKNIIGIKIRESLFIRYFPNSFKKYKELKETKNTEKKDFTERINRPINTLTEEDLFQASKNALIIIELEKIKEEYFIAEWDEREKILGRIHKFSNHSNHRISFEIFDFLEFAASQTRAGITKNIVSSIFSAVLEFCPLLHDKENQEQTFELAKRCIQIGDHIVYDSTIHLRNLEIAMYGLTILKFIYRSAKRNNLTDLTNEVNKTYDELESTLHRPERNDLSNAQELVKVFRDDLDEWDLSFPPLPKHLMDEVYKDRKK